jgi:hypothetical protein
MPLPVDEALYRTWAGVIADLERLARSEEGLPIGELATTISRTYSRGREPSFAPPTGSLDLGRFLKEPRPMRFVMAHLENIRDDPDQVLRDLFGEAYVATTTTGARAPGASLKPSPLVGRLSRMSSEVLRGQDSVARKLRYLLWLN